MEVVMDGPAALPRAAPIVPIEIYRLVQVTRFSNVVTNMNAFHFGIESVPATSSSLVNDWATNIVPAWKSITRNTITFQQVYAQRIYPSPDAVAAVTLSGAGTGGSGPPIPSPCAAIITWRTQLTGRRHRGRTYIAGIEWSISTTSDYIHWSSGGISALTTLGNAILTRYQLGGNPSGFYLGVLSRKTLSEVPPANFGQALAMVTRFSVQNYVGTMGSRRGERGI